MRPTHATTGGSRMGRDPGIRLLRSRPGRGYGRVVTSFVSRILDASFGRPQGLLGRIGGRIMARSNAAVERRTVEMAAPGPDDVVLVVGPGPGVGLRAAGERARLAIGVDPSAVMREAARRRCAELVAAGRVRVDPGTAADTGQPDASVDVVIAVNNVQLWPDRTAGFHELRRVLRPGGRLLVSTHERWLPGGAGQLAADAAEAGFTEVRTETWQPPRRRGWASVVLRARRPVTS